MGGPNWDESLHPRVPAGSPEGGEFTAGDGGGPNWDKSQPNWAKGFHEVSVDDERTFADEAQLEPLTDEERKALDIYHGEDSSVNSVLRDTLSMAYSPEDHAAAKAEADKLIPKLDAAIEKHSMPEDVKLFRGVDGDTWEYFYDLKVGDTFEDPGYVSTTIDHEAAKGFAERIGDTPGGVITILAKEGSLAMPLALTDPRWTDEHEVLLPRNSEFAVREVKGKTMVVELLHGR